MLKKLYFAQTVYKIPCSETQAESHVGALGPAPLVTALLASPAGGDACPWTQCACSRVLRGVPPPQSAWGGGPQGGVAAGRLLRPLGGKGSHASCLFKGSWTLQVSNLGTPGHFYVNSICVPL